MAGGAILRRNMIIRRFLQAGAVSAETAKTPDEVGAFKGLGLLFSRLEAHGKLVKTADDKYYVDETKI